MRILKKTVSLLTDFLILLILACAGLYFYGFRPYVVETGSMTPTLPVGSLCIVNQRFRYEDIQTGDIIVYERENGMRVIHRVIAVTPEGLETQGDANSRSDGVSTTKRNLIGRYVFQVKGVGFMIQWMQTPRGIAMCAVIVAVLIVMSLTFRGGKSREDEDF